MTDPRILLKKNPWQERAWSGTIAEDAVDFMSLIEVILPDFDPTMRWGPCLWMPRDAVSLPQRGDPCLVLFDNNRAPWIVVWRPSEW